MGKSRRRRAARASDSESAPSPSRGSRSRSRSRSRSGSRSVVLTSARTAGKVESAAVQIPKSASEVRVSVPRMNESMNVKTSERMEVNESMNVRKRKNVDECVSAADAAGKRRAVGECVNESSVSQIARMKLIGDELRSFLLNESSKVSKYACDVVLKRVSEYERMLSELMCENANLKGRLASVNQSVSVRASAPTYAGVVAAAPSVLAQPSPTAANVRVNFATRVPVKPTFAVVVKGSENETSENVKNKLVSGVNGSLNVRVKAMRNVKSGGVLVETASAKEKECLKNCERLSSVGLRVEEPVRMDPRVIVYDVPNEMTEERFMRGLYDKNVCRVIEKSEFARAVKVVSRTARKGATVGNIVLEVSPSIRSHLMVERRVYVEWGAYRVNVYERVNRCYGCLGYGHVLRDCKSERLCHRCAKPGHKGADCNSPLNCGNCRARGLPATHSALAPECPEYVWRLERLRARVSGPHNGC